MLKIQTRSRCETRATYRVQVCSLHEGTNKCRAGKPTQASEPHMTFTELKTRTGRLDDFLHNKGFKLLSAKWDSTQRLFSFCGRSLCDSKPSPIGNLLLCVHTYTATLKFQTAVAHALNIKRASDGAAYCLARAKQLHFQKHLATIKAKAEKGGLVVDGCCRRIRGRETLQGN